MRPFPATVTACRQALPGAWIIEMEAPEIAGAARPGQFVMVTCDGEQSLLLRPFSIHGVNYERRRLALLFAVKGNGTGWLAGRRPGDKVKLLGPLGKGFKVEPHWHDLLLVAGGLGVAPLAFLAAEEAGQRRVTLAAGALTSTGLLGKAELPAGIRYDKATEDGSEGRRGRVTTLAEELAPAADAVFACGPLGMLRSMSRASCLAGKPVQVSLEVRMGCGTGLCFGCTINTTSGQKRVCRDGPVFPISMVSWDSVRC
jgi:dihydroorotate dehydrogenase electron transfer subunit